MTRALGPGMTAFHMAEGNFFLKCSVCGALATQWVSDGKKVRDYCDEHGFGRKRPRSLVGLAWREVKLFGSWVRELWLSWVSR